MKIAIDARMIKPDSMHGIARYVYELLICLKKIGTEHLFYVFINKDSPLFGEQWPEHIKLVEISSKWISFGEQWEVPKKLRELSIELFHSPSFVGPLMCPCQMIMTIHDLNHLVLPQFYTPLHQFYYQTFVRSCIQRSRYILTVSEFSKKEIVENLGLDPQKVFVTYNGVSQSYRPIADKELLSYVRDIYELPDEFILCVSNNKPHKNVQQLLRAYCYSDLKVPIVLASPVDRSLIQIAENYGKKHLVYFSKFIAEEHLPAVYSMTKLFVYPSTYEGFGLPPLEALSCGVPVVVARSSSLPEVVGDHAIFTNPYDYQDIARALHLGVESETLRSRLVEDGIAHARKFSWQSMANQTLAIYEKCMTALAPQPTLSRAYENRN